jgi:hypothetical protein
MVDTPKPGALPLGTGTVGMRPRGAVTIGGAAAGIVVVVVVVDVVVVLVVVVVEVVVDVVVARVVVVDCERASFESELHATPAITSSTQTLLRPRRRCTPS